MDAIKHEFVFSILTTCEGTWWIPSQISLEILDDILGKKVGTVFIEGLVDENDTNDFDAKLESLDTASTSDMEGFLQWFQTYKAPVMWSSMIVQVREECGLGSPPAALQQMHLRQQTTLLKHKVNYKQSELPEFSKKLGELIKLLK